MPGALLESDLQRMVPGVRIEWWQPFEAAIKLWEGFKKQLLRNCVINVARIRHVGCIEDRASRTPGAGQCRTRREEALEGIRHFRVEVIRDSGAGGIVSRIQFVDQRIPD